MMNEQRLLPHVVVNTQDGKLLLLLWSNCGVCRSSNPSLESFYTLNMPCICMAAAACNTEPPQKLDVMTRRASAADFRGVFSVCTGVSRRTRGKPRRRSRAPRSDVSRCDFDDAPRLLLSKQFCFDVPIPRRRSVLLKRLARAF